MQRIEYPAGDSQRVVAYFSEDTGSPIDYGQLLSAFAADAAALEQGGWSIVATTSLPMRETGTAGNVLFQSGGQYATQVALAVTYRKA